MEKDWDKDRDIYNKDINRKDIVVKVKALGIGLKKIYLFTNKNYFFYKQYSKGYYIIFLYFPYIIMAR